MNKVTFNDFAVIIVIYNKDFYSCETFISLQRMDIPISDKLDLFIYDNSPDRQEIANLGKLTVAAYVHDPQNSGISKAYNECAKLAADLGKKWLIFLDQDSCLTESLFIDYSEAIENHSEIMFFCPILKSSGFIVSPSIFKNRMGSSPSYLTAGMHSFKKLSPINSGICIEINLFFKAGGYDEKVPLDYSDYAFIYRVKQIVEYFFLLDNICEHGLSSYEEQVITSALSRFRYLCIGLVNSSTTLTDKIFSLYVAGKRGAKLSFKFKNAEFLKILYAEFYSKL